MTNKTYPPTGYPLFEMHRDHANTVFAKIECDAINIVSRHKELSAYLMAEPWRYWDYKYKDDVFGLPFEAAP